MLKVKNKISISSRTYNFGKDDSRSYIYDEELRFEYLLEGVSSDIWYLIYSSHDYNSVLEYAKKCDVDDELDEFLNDLYTNNLIEISNTKL